MRKTIILVALLCLTLCAAGCSPDGDGVGEADIEFHRVTEASLQQDTTEEDSVGMNPSESAAYTADTKIADVQSDPAFGTYGRLIFPVDEGYYECQATLYGTVTMERSYSSGLAPADLKGGKVYPREDYVADSDVKNYIVSLDPKGVLGWDSQYIEKKKRPKAHIIEVLTGQVMDEYIAYLRDYDISYIFAGDQVIDCPLLLSKLKALFGIERLMIAGGGYTNWSFLKAGCVDELSLVIAPLADGSTTSVSIFERADYLPRKAPISLSLKEMKQVDGNGVWLRYEFAKSYP